MNSAKNYFFPIFCELLQCNQHLKFVQMFHNYKLTKVKVLFGEMA